MENEFKINVCVCTYLRAKHLGECLASLVNQVDPPKATYSITVIDNDKNQSAKPVVSNFQNKSKVPLYYFCEENRGIPFARNRALDESLKLGADNIVFIDDDECASQDWLSTLYAYSLSHSGSVVIHGRVIPRFPKGTSQHLREIFHTRKERLTGTRLQTCATDNVIFSTGILNEFKLHFDNSSPLSGGTDTKFFFEANRRGVPIYECAEAIVYETVFPSRLNMNWLMRRKYRAGITTAWRRMQERKSKFELIAKSIGGIFFHAFIGCLALLCFHSVKRDKQFLKVAKYSGILTGTFGMNVNSYAVVNN